jgi:hypothetical protein
MTKRVCLYSRLTDAAAQIWAADVDRRLRSALPNVEVLQVLGDRASVTGLLTARPDVIVVLSGVASEISELYCLRAKVVWDMSLLDATAVSGSLAGGDDVRTTFRHAIASAQSFASVQPGVGEMLEDAFKVGVTGHKVEIAVKTLMRQVGVVIGEGLGNMIYATPLVRWVATQIGAPVDIIINNRFDDAIHLFAQSRFVNVVYSSYESRCTNGRWRASLVSVTAGTLVKQDRELQRRRAIYRRGRPEFPACSARTRRRLA